MREIKFRAWDEKTKTMVYQGSVDLETLQSFIFHWGDKKLMQFTGLHDKNGKEIYEGDVLREQQEDCDPETWLVEWYVDDINCGWNTDPAMTWYSEVIGNIYENPELLEVKDEG
ncbi:MAG: YopX family protein [Syntrophaceae bacterium]